MFLPFSATFQNHRIIEASWNHLVQPSAQVGSQHTESCPGLHIVGYGVSTQKKIPWPHKVTSASISPPSWYKMFSSVHMKFNVFLICAHYLLSCQWVPVRRVWLPFHSLPPGICMHEWGLLETSAPRLECPSSLRLSSYERCSSSFTLFVALHWTHFSMSTSLLLSQHCTQHSRYIPPVLSGEEGSLQSADRLCLFQLPRLLAHVPFGVYQDPLVLFCKYAFQLNSPQHILVHGAVPPKSQIFALPL